MSKPNRVGSLEIAEDMDFQRRSWKVQRAGWVVMLGVAVAALLGAFGDGPLSSAEAGSSASGLRIEYERFARLHAPETLDIEVSQRLMSADSLRIWIDRSWLGSKEIRVITPEADGTRSEADRIVFTFGGSGARGPVHVRFHLETRSPGSVRGRAGVIGGPSHALDQFVYP